MRYIITGATGFIGYALYKKLLTAGNEVVAVVRPDSGKVGKLMAIANDNSDMQKRLQIIELPLDELEKLSAEHNITADVFFHLAWNGSSGAAREDFDTQYSNVLYMANAIRAAKACGCRRIIGAGSQAEYGVVRGKAYEDTTVPKPFMMYGAAKTAAYEMGKVLAGQEGIEFVWPRIYSVYGVGENPGTLVSYVLDCVVNNQSPELSLCENMWNFINIADCVDMLLMLSDLEKKVEGIYHIASRDTRLLKDFVMEIMKVTESGVKPFFGAKQSNPDRTFWLEPDTAKIEALGACCKVSFEDGIRAEFCRKF